MGLTSKPFQSYVICLKRGHFYVLTGLEWLRSVHCTISGAKVSYFDRNHWVPFSPSFLERGPQIPSQHLATWNKDSSISQPPLQLSMGIWLRSVPWDISGNVLWQRPQICLEVQLVSVSSPQPPLFLPPGPWVWWSVLATFLNPGGRAPL